MHEAGVPAGVFNLVNGDGPGVGTALSKHPDVDMVSFTGSTRAGVLVAQNAAPTVKRVTQELGGKSANIILNDADLEKVIAAGMKTCTVNSGQSCNAPTRMLVPMKRMDEAVGNRQGGGAGGERRVTRRNPILRATGCLQDPVGQGPTIDQEGNRGGCQARMWR